VHPIFKLTPVVKRNLL